MRNSILSAAMLALLCAAVPAFAQKAPVAGQLTSSEPGKVGVVEGVKAAAVVTAIDKASRTVTLKGAEGRVFDVVCGDGVKNFEQIKVGDEVVVEYARALSLEVKKAAGKASASGAVEAARAKPGDKPAGAVGRELTVVADVVDVDPAKKTITLKGPKGNVVELDVKNPEHFKVVKKGDQVEARYAEALAISVEPAAKKATKK